MTDSDTDSPSTSPVRIPSVRGMLLARTHFEVLGFDGGSLRPRDVSDEEVRSAYRRCARAVRASRDLGSAVAECRVAEAFAALRTPEAREETWRATAAPPSSDGPVGADADADERARRAARLGKLRSTKNDAPGLARVPWTVDFPVENSVAVGPVDKRALIAARRRASGDEETRDAFAANAAEAPDDDAFETTSEPAPAASLRDEREFLVRECGFPGTKPRLCAFWVGGTLGSRTDPLALRYAWREGKGKINLAADGAWELGRGDVVRVVRTRASKTSKTSKTAFANPALDGGVKLVATEHVANAHVPGWILTSPDTLKNKKNKNESLDAWAASLRALLPKLSPAAPGTPPPPPRGKGGLRGTAPSPVRRHLVP